MKLQLGLLGDFKDNFLDFGTDNMHPGIKTHQYYAELIIKKINDLNIGIDK